MGFAHFLLAGVLDRLGHPAAAAVEYGATADTLGKHPGRCRRARARRA